MTKIEKFYFLWLEEISNKCRFNISIFEEIMKKFNSIEELYNVSKNIEKLKVNIKDLNLDNSIITNLSDNNIKGETIKKYKYIKNNNLNIVSYKDEQYPKEILLNFKENAAFCIIFKENINFKDNIFIFYDNYFTKFARNLFYYFTKILEEKNFKVLSVNNYLNYDNVINIGMYNELECRNSAICFINKNHMYWFILAMSKVLIIIEAQYEEEIVRLVDIFLEYGKDIYVVPSNVFKRNSYFSNYLIQSGANVLLNKRDLNYIVNSY